MTMDNTLVNRAVTDTWEPGSVNKTITAAAALSSGAVQPSETFQVGGTRTIEGYTIHDWIDFEDANYVRVKGDVDIASGIRALVTPGHTPGHQSVTVETDDGLILIAGQAAQDARDFATAPATPSLQRLRALNAARIHFSHDRAVLKRAGPTTT